MSLKEHNIRYRDQEFTRFIGTSISSREDMWKLGQGSYFFGGIIDTGDSITPFFCEGPNHAIVDQMAKEVYGPSSMVHTCQISLDSTSGSVQGIVFRDDPVQQTDTTLIDFRDRNIQARRKARILTLLHAIAPECYFFRVFVGWHGLDADINQYVYIPKEDMLRKYPYFSKPPNLR